MYSYAYDDGDLRDQYSVVHNGPVEPDDSDQFDPAHLSVVLPSAPAPNLVPPCSPLPVRGRLPKDPNKPKGRVSAFVYFTQDYRPLVRQQYPQLPVAQVGKLLADKWRSMSEQERWPYQQKSNQDSERFKAEMAMYVPPVTPIQYQEAAEETKRRKRKKDPNKPKGRTSAYMYFSQEYRKKMEVQYPGLAVTEISKKLGEKWKLLTAEEKKPFHAKAEIDKERHQKEMAVYVPPKDTFLDKKKKKKKKKDPNAPKRPLSAFFLFSDDFRSKIREEHPTIPFKEISKRLGEMWRNLSKEQQKPYCERSEVLKKKYERDVEIYKNNQLMESDLLPPPLQLLDPL